MRVVIVVLLHGRAVVPELSVGAVRINVAATTNLLDALLDAGIKVASSCRAGSCHSCMVRCVRGELLDAQPHALNDEQRAQGWRLACQCQVLSDSVVQVFDPLHDGIGATISACDWLTASVLRLRLRPERRVRYQAGQHMLLWAAADLARPYSLASLPEEDEFLEFHLDCQQTGAFSNAARHFAIGQTLHLGALGGGALHYDAHWQDRPLWLLAAGTGLAPLLGVLREALRQEHRGPIRVLHLAHDATGHYLKAPLELLSTQHPQVQVQFVSALELASALAELRLVSRQTMALLCGSPTSVEAFARRLYLLGLPRNQILADVFLPRAR
jgi:ferredoxin-NADP reductase/ferredoxin